MNWYLFVWNPQKDIDFKDIVSKWREDRSVPRRFSCGRRSDIMPGDRAVLRRTGSEEKGIVGIGTVVVGSREEPWVDGGELGNFVHIEWEQLSDTPIIPRDDPDVAELDELWRPQSNGTILPGNTGEYVSELAGRYSAWVEDLPSLDEFIAHWSAHPPTEKRKRMLAAHYLSPEVAMHPRYLAAKMDWSHPRATYLHYGGFASATAEAIGVDLTGRDEVSLFARWTGKRGDVRWVMHDRVRQAIEHFGWQLLFPDLAQNFEPSEEQILLRENQSMQTLVAIRGRNASVRDHCLAAHLPVCAVCNLDPIVTFGATFRGLLEVHHLNPMAESEDERLTDPKEDCRPLCPTCHRLAHYGMPVGKCRPLDELRRMRQRG